MTRVLGLLGKGGTGKTTSAAALGHAYARRGHRVLLVDLDAQTSLTDWLAGGRRDVDVADVVQGEKALDEALVQVADGLDLLPGNAGATVMLERFIESRPRRREEVIAGWLSGVKGYDLVVLDTPRGLGSMLSVNTVEASDAVVVPAELSGMSLDALRQLVEFVREVGEQRGRPGLLAGILPTRVPRTRLAAAARESIETAGLPVLHDVPGSTRVAEAVAVRRLPADYDRRNAAVEAYELVADQLSSMLFTKGRGA